MSGIQVMQLVLTINSGLAINDCTASKMRHFVFDGLPATLIDVWRDRMMYRLLIPSPSSLTVVMCRTIIL